MKKPSDRIKELAKEIHAQGIDPFFNGNVPDAGDYIEAIVRYLDEIDHSDNREKI